MAAVHAGADAIGLVFYAGSPRHVDVDTARRIVVCLPPFVTATGLFVNAPEEQVRETVDAVHLGLLQFHGEETNLVCKQYGKPFIKSVAMRDATDLDAALRAYPDASALLLDAWHPELHGGSGTRFDWGMIPAASREKVILAGGLTPDNVGEAVSCVRPYAVDVSSGVEEAKGIKSAEKIHAFIEEVRKSETG